MSFDVRLQGLGASVLTCLLFTGAVGCGGESVNRPTRVPVFGTVMMNGQPVGGATIVFAPIVEKYGATAMTDDQGRFALRTFEAGDGAVPGRYQISIRKIEMVPGKMARSGEEGSSGEGGEGEEVDTKVEKFITPEKYASPKSSGLIEEVTEAGPNEFTFDLSA